MKLTNYILALLVLVLTFNSCKKDDTTLPVIEARDRAEQYLEDIASIEAYLSTHFYNYEAFEANPNTTDFQIVFDTIDENNPDKIPLIERVELKDKMVTDFEGVEYKLYYLQVRVGNGLQPQFSDSTFVDYKGTLIDATLFDSTPNPTWFDLTAVVQGFREVSTEFKGSDVPATDNGDGTFTFENYGIGAMFIPSGLGYFASPQLGIPSYSPLIFTFSMFKVNDYTDHDRDGIPSYLEDLDGDRSVRNDNTDEDLFFNYIDSDDDGDGVATRDELEFNEYIVDTNNGGEEPTLAANEYINKRVDNDGVITINTVVIIDTNGDSTPDYLDSETANSPS